MQTHRVVKHGAFFLFVNLLTVTTCRNPRGASYVCATRDLLIFTKPLCSLKNI